MLFSQVVEWFEACERAVPVDQGPLIAKPPIDGPIGGVGVILDYLLFRQNV